MNIPRKIEMECIFEYSYDFGNVKLLQDREWDLERVEGVMGGEYDQDPLHEIL